jgi:hypothetical protein
MGAGTLQCAGSEVDPVNNSCSQGPYSSPVGASAKLQKHRQKLRRTLFALRLCLWGAIGPHVAAIAVQDGIDVEEDLARVLPALDDDTQSA